MHALPDYDEWWKGGWRNSIMPPTRSLSRTPRNHGLNVDWLRWAHDIVARSKRTGSESAEPEFAGLMDLVGCLRRGKPLFDQPLISHPPEVPPKQQNALRQYAEYMKTETLRVI